MDLRRFMCRVLAMSATSLAGCAQTSRVDEAALSAATAAGGGRGIALMRVGAASPNCENVAVLLGTRQGDGFRRGQAIKVVNVRSPAEAPVAEVELEPGEHHVIGYACQSARGTKTVMDKADAQTYRTSYARFIVQAGEVVNVGHLHFGASHTGRSAFGRPLKLDVSVTDWPLREIELFRQKRPALYARMHTRLMTVTEAGPAPPAAAECARLQALKTEGKVQALPPACTPPVATSRPRKQGST